jgi:hypothetical protein
MGSLSVSFGTLMSFVCPFDAVRDSCFCEPLGSDMTFSAVFSLSTRGFLDGAFLVGSAATLDAVLALVTLEVDTLELVLVRAVGLVADLDLLAILCACRVDVGVARQFASRDDLRHVIITMRVSV